MATLTDAQLATFKADIEGNTNQTVIDALAAGANNAIADWYSGDASPDYWVYKNLVPIEEVSEVVELDDVANMTTGDNDKLKTFYQIRQGGVFAYKASDRDGFDDIFSAAAGNDTQQALIALWKRLSNELEKVFATGGAGTNGDPATMGVDGSCSLQNVRDALALP